MLKLLKKQVDIMKNLLENEYKNRINDFNSDERNLLYDYLIKRAEKDEAIVFYYKMKGDFNRYIAEYSKGDLKKQFEDSGLKAYDEAIERVPKLQILNPLHLRLFLNYSIFQYEILNNKKKAIVIAKYTINEIIKTLPDTDEDDANIDFISIYNNLKENVDFWEKEKRKLI